MILDITAKQKDVSIFGAGMTDLAAGYVLGLPVYEMAEWLGSICYSYYVRSGNTQRGTERQKSHHLGQWVEIQALSSLG